MPYETLWSYEEPISDLVDVPAWIEQDITGTDVAGILQIGCANGAYMPAHWWAIDTMSDHGDDVLQFLRDHLGQPPRPSDNESWSGMAVHYLSEAVELWASRVEEELTEAIENETD